MNDIVAEARDRIAALKHQIEILEEFLRSADQAVVLLRGDVNTTTRLTGSLSVGTRDAIEPDAITPAANFSEESPKRTRVTDNPKPAVLIPAAIEILRSQGSPMSRRELHEALSAKGLVVRGSDPIKALGTILWRAQDQIVQVEGFGYWPKADRYPPGKYWGDAHDLLG